LFLGTILHAALTKMQGFFHPGNTLLSSNVMWNYFSLEQMKKPTCSCTRSTNKYSFNVQGHATEFFVIFGAGRTSWCSCWCVLRRTWEGNLRNVSVVNGMLSAGMNGTCSADWSERHFEENSISEVIFWWCGYIWVHFRVDVASLGKNSRTRATESHSCRPFEILFNLDKFLLLQHT
jgi:hypothetical protein